MSYKNGSKILRALSSPNLIALNSSSYSTYSQPTQTFVVYADKDKKSNFLKN